MDISLTKEQLETLVELAYLGEWMANAHHIEPTKKYAELAAKIYSSAAQAGSDRVIEYPVGSKKHAPSGELDNALQKMRAQYDEISFWNELIERLAVRDLERKLGFEAVQQLGFDEYSDAQEAASLPYQDEFDHHGIDNLEIVAGETKAS